MQTVMKTGTIVKAISGFYYCKTEGTVYECRGRGAFRNEKLTPLVGDQVRFEVEESEEQAALDESISSRALDAQVEHAIMPLPTSVYESGRGDAMHGGFVTEILPRKNEFTRPPIANLDKLFIVASVAQPSPSTLVIDKLTTVCEYKEIEPIIVITKTDLGDSDELSALYRKAGFRVICLSNVENGDYSEIRECLRGCTSAFAGNTGVGKSSLLNNVCPGLGLTTSHISQKLGRGRHTTRHVELFWLAEWNACVADTPGFGTMDMARYENIRKEQLQYCFREFEPYLEECRFTGCSHRTEKGCAVLDAVREGTVSASRHESYTVLYNEASQVKEWELEKHS